MYHAQHLQTQQLQPPNQQHTSQQQQDQVRWKVKTPMHSPQSTSEASRKQPYPRPQYY
uniref:Uncharacterized protein n=2 Tax=gambiae species complex TaxID=44542 RepID=A0A182XTK1_ANOQN